VSESLLERAARYIDEGVYEGHRAVNPLDATLHEVGDDIALVAGFSHVVARRTPEGLVLFDTSLPAFAPLIRDAIAAWSPAVASTIVYTHGHVDHVGGGPVFADAARYSRGEPPRVVAHERVPARFRRYELTDGYNAVVNERQFGTGGLGAGAGAVAPGRRFALDWLEPGTLYRDDLDLVVGGVAIELHHAEGETDDHTYAWMPDQRAVCSGDLLCWIFPNAGNPQKVQRYPREWALALREIAALGPELLLPAHGLPIAGRDRIHRVLDATASALEVLVDQTLALMNEGATLDRIVHEVALPPHLAALPYLQPVYDEPEFVVRNVWRLYGGWYDGNPAHLKPPREAALAAEVAALAGGPDALARRASELATAGDLRLAAQLVEWAAAVAPDDPGIRAARAGVYAARRAEERSLMAKGIFGAAAAESAGSAGRAGAAPGADRAD
jgi:alkyl sulfatase BDS1-like metallo-beta-lactamase superfamily hydrolase